MGIQKLAELERELNDSYTESLTINTEPTNPHFGDILRMVGDRVLSLSLRKQMSTN